MKRFTLILVLVVMAVLSAVAQKKDTGAWKNETNLDAQFRVYKKNVNFWNGSYFMKPELLDEFHAAIMDSVKMYETTIISNKTQISSLQKELAQNAAVTKETQAKLDESIKLQNAITVFGLPIEKTTYAVILYSIILGLLVLTGVVFLMFKRSNTVTVNTKKEYAELKEEFEAHKKSSLDRYTKMNMELHKTRLELNKK
jgi:hypothetical protein